MSEDLSSGPNAAQATYWTETVGQSWVALQDLMDAQLRGLGLVGIEALAPTLGERLIDIGAGCGDTTLELARRAGPTGFVTSADISAPMLAVAKARAGAAGLGWTEFVVADAQTYPFAPADAAFSRFGSMFFIDPVAAFANIRRALKPGGRMVLVCWRALAENLWMKLPADAVTHLLPEPPAPAPPGTPGPFAFADGERLGSILRDAGFAEVGITPHDQPIGWPDLDTGLQIVLSVGPTAAAARENPHLREAMTTALRDALAAHVGPDGVKLASATWIVQAR